MATTARRFIPRLQILDERALPSVTYVPVAGTTTLIVMGDAAPDVITITDDGTANGLQVTTINDLGEVVLVFSGSTTEISQIEVQSGAGNDTVVYNLSGSLQVTRLISAKLGRGHDSFTTNFTGVSLDNGSHLNITAEGQGGADTLVLTADGLGLSPGSILNVTYTGGAGKDTITFPGSLDITGVTLIKDQRR